MSNELQAISGRAVHKLSEIISATDFPLLAFLPADMQTAFFENVHFADPVVYREGSNTVTNLMMLYEGDIQLQLPTSDAFRFLIGGRGSGWSHFSASIAVGSDPYLTIRDFTVALQLSNDLLEDVESGEPAAIYIAADMGFSATGISFDNVTGASLNPAYLLGSRIIISANHILPRFDPMTLSVDTLEEVSFLGIDIHQLQMTLPLDFLTLPGNSSITFQLDSVAISERGFTGRVSLQGDEFNLQEGGVFKELPIRPREIGIDISENQFIKYFAGFDIRLAFLESATVENWISVDFGLGASQTAKARLLAPINFDIRGSEFQLTIDSFEAAGVWNDAGISFDGAASGQLKLHQFDIALGQTTFHYDHTDTTDTLICGLENLTLGPLGQVSIAEFHLKLKTNANEQREIDDFFVRVEFQWSELSARLSLNELPDFVPAPPDDALVYASIRWVEDQGGETMEIKFSTLSTDPSNLWKFIPAQFQPEIGQTMLQFHIRYTTANEFNTATTADNFTADVTIQTNFKLPALNELMNLEYFDVSTGDEEGWIEATARTRVEQDAAGNTEAHLDFELANAIALAVQLPGLSQDDPPIAINITSIDLELGNSTTSTGRMKLAGAFAIRPLQPSISLPLAAPIKKLLAPITAAELGGMASAELEFKDDKAIFSLACDFEDTKFDIDLFDMLAGLTQGMPTPNGLSSENNIIDLDLEIGFNLEHIALKIGSLTPSESTQLHLVLKMGLSVFGVHTDFSFQLSEQQVAFGFTELAIPIKFPDMPLRLDDLNELRGAGGWWDAQKWTDSVEPEIVAELDQLKLSVKEIQEEITALEIELSSAEPPADRAVKAATLKQLKRRDLPNINEQSLHLHAKRFLIDAILALHQMMSGSANRSLFQSYVEAYQTMVDNTLGLIQLDTDLLLVLSDVRFVLPFDNPADIGLTGKAKVTGFTADSPFAPLGDMELSLGISAEYIYFAVEGGGDPIPLPEFGRYKDGNINLKHLRIGYGYTKNSFAMSFAGELKLPPALVEDADTSAEIGFGIRLPVQTRLAFSIDMIPVVLGEVDFVIPLPAFDIDLRQDGTPGLRDSRVCEPYWDGLQVIVPNITRWAFKKAKFSPFYGPIPAPNFNFSYDYSIGTRDLGVTMVCDNYLIIAPVMGQYPIPFLADGTPYFDNLCASIRLGGFGVNFNLQRPTPSMSPMAIFEIMGLLADPNMPIDPTGALAVSMRATIEHAYVSVPPHIVQLFPALGTVVEREVNYTLNLGMVITLAQSVTPWLTDAFSKFDEAQSSVHNLIDDITDNPPPLTPSNVLKLLPQSLRSMQVEGSFAGFAASATIVLMTKEEALLEFDRRDDPILPLTYTQSLEDTFASFDDQQWRIVNQGHRVPEWTVSSGSLTQSSNTHKAAEPLQAGTFVANKTLNAGALKSIRAVLHSEAGGAGVMFGVADDRNYYRFAIYDRSVLRLIKVKNNSASILFESSDTAVETTRFSVVIDTSPNRAGISRRRRDPSVSALQIKISVNGTLWCDLLDATNPFAQGSVGLYSWKNTEVRFDRIEVSEPTSDSKLAAGVAVTGQNAYARPPVPVSVDQPVFDPHAPENNLFAAGDFAGFNALVLDAIESASTDSAGVIAAAQVQVLDQQSVRFFGVLFSDGHFTLLSEINASDLSCQIAGVNVKLPFALQTRMILTGRANGAESHATIRASGWANWNVIPNQLQIKAGDKNSPVNLVVSSNGQFALTGEGQVIFYNGAATLVGAFDISHTHCLVRGELRYVPNFVLGRQRVIDLTLDIEGRVGPGPDFVFSGSGQLSVLGNELAAVQCHVSNKLISVAGDVRMTQWGALPINEFVLSATGSIALENSRQPEFTLAGHTTFRCFSDRRGNALEIKGRGEIRARAGKVSTILEGQLRWHNRDWFRGRIELSENHIQVEGSTSFALNILELPLNLQSHFASLYFSIEISGKFGLTTAGKLTSCDLELRWMLAIKMPGSDQQMLPVAMQSIAVKLPRINSRSRVINLKELLKFNSLSVLPVDGISIPVPEITPVEYTRLYTSTIEVGGGTASIPMIKHEPNFNSLALVNVPTEIELVDKNISLDLGIGFPTPEITVQVPSLTGYHSFYLGDTTMPFPTIEVPSLSTSNSSGAIRLLEVPSNFDVKFTNESLTSLLENLECTLSLGWKDNELGLIVFSKNRSTFSPFSNMF